MDKILSIDIETYCELNLKEVGVYRYVDHPSFEVLMLAWAFNDEPVQLVDFMAGEKLPQEVERHIVLPDYSAIKSAHNANFERTCLAKKYVVLMPPQEWQCTMVHAMELGLPAGLARVAAALNLPQDQQKMKEGKALIEFFSKPCRPTRANKGRTRNLPHHDPERWELFKKYCMQDVVTERAVRKTLETFPIPKTERYLWQIDQTINDRGVRLDREFISKAIQLDTLYSDRLMAEAQELTQLQNPNSLPQLKSWLNKQTGDHITVTSLTKKDVPGIIAATENPAVERMLEIRQELGKTSTSKYHAMARCICDDDRARGLVQFYGGRTGRWAGRLIQVQNLPQNKIPDLALARELLRAGHFKGFELLYGNVPDILSQLIRTALVPSPGNLLYVADFSAIEARMIAWVAKEKWRMDVFNSHGKIYEASAAQMFGVPIETIAKDRENYALRAKGKIAELALGYGGSVGALTAMGALDMGLEKNELKPLVDTWRRTNPAITELWWSVEACAIEAVKTKCITMTHGLEFQVENGVLFIKLHSGRRLAYVRPHIIQGQYNKEQLAYEGIDQTKNKWMVIDTYGPKLVENIIQALSRDCLAHALIHLYQHDYNTVMHVHDEVIIEAPADNPNQTLTRIERIMAKGPSWAEGLPLNADGYYCEFYQKD
jgi:DNA polymerase